MVTTREYDVAACQQVMSPPVRDYYRIERAESHKARTGYTIVRQVKADITICHVYGVEVSIHAVY